MFAIRDIVRARPRLPRGAAATTFPIAPTVHYHPHSQAASIAKTGTSVTSCPDMSGLAPLSGFAADGTTVVGPTEMTDSIGRKFWRFNGTGQYATISNVLAGMSSRATTTLAVVRVSHGARSAVYMVSPRYATYTSDTVNTAASGVFGMLKSTATSSSAGFLTGPSSPVASSNAATSYKAIPGAQLQVAGIASRTVTNGGQRIYVNNDTCDITQATTLVTGYLGAIIGGSAGAANTANVTTSANNTFDLYEVAIWNSELTNAQSDAAAAAMVANYAIPQITQQIVIDGDSISDGIVTTLGVSPAWGGNLAAWMTDPLNPPIPPNVRVVNLGTSGNTVAALVAKRDAVNSVYTQLMPGGAANNIVAFQIGRNDATDTYGKNSGAMYTDIVALINTTTTGYLQRGWKVFVAANIAGPSTAVTTNISPVGENTIQKRLEGLRAKIADTTAHLPLGQFLTDTLTNTAQTFVGNLSVLHLYDIVVGANTPFKTAADSIATAPGYYDNDLTHQRVPGHQLMVNGGDTPQYGYGIIL